MEEWPLISSQTLLSHIPRHNDFSKLKIFVLIYSPHMKENTLDTTTSNLPPPSLSSSFSNIGHDQAQSPSDENKAQLYVMFQWYAADIC
jgi:hypothetical protein